MNAAQREQWMVLLITNKSFHISIEHQMNHPNWMICVHRIWARCSKNWKSHKIWYTDHALSVSLSLAICPQCNERSCVLFFSSDSNYLWPNSRNKTKTFEILKIRCDDLVSMVHATARTPNNKTPNLITPNSKENKENTYAFRGMWAQLG